jgi:hypothetical protein
MSIEEERQEGLLGTYGYRFWVAVALVGGLVVAAVVMWVAKGTTRPVSPGATAVRPTVTDDELAAARDTLSREPNLDACKAAVGQLNAYVNRHADRRPPALGPEERDQLAGRFGLAGAELAEVDSGTYTALDAHHTDECFLLRDAARALDAEETGPQGRPLRPEPVERAAAAFRWVVREVRHIEHGLGRYGLDLAPPAYVLRRGWGNSRERALVFLALLAQDAGPERLTGCLLSLPGEGNGPPRLWACGVAVGDGKDVYLFDPRAGLPLPGPGGRGVATLAQAVKDPSVLARLDVDAGHRYDVKPEQARAAEGLAVFPLSSLSPRMRHLQDTLLGRGSAVRLASDPADLDRIAAAVKASGGPGASVWKPGVGTLRRFLPAEQGGADAGGPFPLNELPGFVAPDDQTRMQMNHVKLFELTLVPWEALPPQFNPVDFPFTVGLGQTVRENFAAPFMKPVRDPRGARELLLRGQYAQAVPKLVSEDGELREWVARRAAATDLDRNMQEWLKVAREAYVEQQRAKNAGNARLLGEVNKRIESLWGGKSIGPVAILLFGASSGPRDAEVTYQLGLAMHEQAEQRQARLDLLAKAGVTPAESDVERCRQAWTDAKGWWDRFATDFGQGFSAPAARQNRGRAEAMLGDWSSAAATRGDLSGPMTPLEQVAALYRAREAREHLPAKK